MTSIDKLQKSQMLLGLDSAIIEQIANCYGMFAEAFLGSAGMGIIESNKSTYDIILDSDIIDLMTLQFMSNNLSNSIAKYPKLGEVLDVRSPKYIQKLVTTCNLISPIKTNNINEIVNAIQVFGISSGIEDNTGYDEDEFSGDPDLKAELADLNGIDFSDNDTDGIPEHPIMDGKVEIDPDELDLDDQDFDIQLDDVDIESTGIEESQSPIEAEAEENETEHYKSLKDTWGGKLESVINSIMKSYDLLYKSGYGVVNPSGILTNQGIVCSKKGQNTISWTGDRALDIEVYTALHKAIGEPLEYYANISEEPSISRIMSVKAPITFPGMHIKFLFGHLDFCTGKNGLRRYLTAHNIPHEGITRVAKYSDIRGWIKETVERYFYEAYSSAGISSDITPENIQKTNEINSLMARSLKNVIIVAERNNGISTRIRVCIDEPLNVQSVINSLNSTLNIRTSSNIVVKQIGSYNNGVLDLDIIYNEKAHSQSSLFAYQVLDTLEEQGIRPSWSNVILGKKEDGTIMTYDFRDANNSSIALYGAKGSGKGVMTLNLIASALAEGCILSYIDAKPDTAIPLAQVTWKDGLDGFIYNGKEVPGASLERQGNCPRQVDRFYSKSNIPTGLFNTEAELEKFILLTTYYRGVELVLDMAEERASVLTNGGHNDRWMVAIFDEIQQLAFTEGTVVSKLTDIKKQREKHKEEVDGKIKGINYFKDPIWMFIDAYERWRATLEDRMATALGSTFRKAEITTIWIWQTSNFPGQYATNSIAAKAILQESSSMVKIMGRGAAAGRNGSIVFGTYSDLTHNTTWYDHRFTGGSGGFWAIGNSVNSDKDMKVFRPFNVYSSADNKQLLLQNASNSGLSEQDLYYQSLNPDGTIIPEIGFEGYVNRLLRQFGLTASQQLNIGWQYATKYVTSMGLGNSLEEFMYNAHEFNLANSNTSNTNEEKDVTNGFNLNDLGQEADDEEIDFGDAPTSSDTIQDSWEQPPIEQRRVSDPKRLSREDNEIIERARQIESYEQSHFIPQTDPKEVRKSTLESQQPAQVRGENRFEPSPFDGDTTEYDVDNQGDTPSGTYTGPVGPEVTKPNTTSPYRYGGQKDGYFTFLTPQRTSKIMGLTSENSFVVTVHDHRSHSMSSKLLSTFKGTQYELQSRWKAILNGIAKSQNPTTITRVTICSDIILFNKRQVAAMGLLGGEDDIQVADIVNFTELAKRFPNIKELRVDREIYHSAAIEFNGNPEFGMFRTLRNLVKLGIWEIGYGSSPDIITRSDVEQGIRDQEIQRRNTEDNLRSKIDAMAAANNPRFSQKSGISQARVINGSKNLTGAGWNHCKSQFSKGHYLRGGILGTFTIGAAAITGTLLGITKLSGMFKRGR